MIYPEHIQWIIDNRTEALNQSLSQDNSYKTTNNPLEVFLDADPTPKKKLAQWLVDTYINGGFRWEDIQSGSNSKVFDTLSLYIKHKSKLDSDNHIAQYDTLGSVYKDIVTFMKSEKSGRSVKRDKQAQAYEESYILVKSDSLTVVIPKTEYASKWWGKGTQWCTAGDKNNVFHRYNKSGPLIIIIINGIKIQLYIDLINKNRSVQFMDEHDIPVELDFIKDNWSLLKPILEYLMNHNRKTLQHIPKSLRTAELCLEAVRQDGETLCHVPKRLRTAELCMEAVKQNADSLVYVPVSLQTAELFLEAVKQNGGALVYVPENFITAELCLEAVKQDGESLREVPENFRITGLCLEAVINNGLALAYVPKQLKTPELCLEAVKQSGESLSWVPEALRTAELCLEAVRQNGEALLYVPKRLRTPKLCLEALEQSGEALFHIPEPLKTREIWIKALRQDFRFIYFIPEHLRIEEFYLESVRQSGRVLEDIPENLRTEEICLRAVRQNGLVLYYVPENLKTFELCLEAVKQNGKALRYVPEGLKTLELESSCKEYNFSPIASNSNIINWDHNFLKELRFQLENRDKLVTDRIYLS